MKKFNEKGYCPTCNSPIVTKKGDRVVCATGHIVAPGDVRTDDVPVSVQGFSSDPITYEIAQYHTAGLDRVRANIARIGYSNPGMVSGVLAISIVSAGPNIEDQLIVYSPGGTSEKNARALVERLKSCVEHVEYAIENGEYDKF